MSGLPASVTTGTEGALPVVHVRGPVADAVVHRGGLVATPWSRQVCFAGLGPGEVTVAGRKVVGVAQRRTRHGARFQVAALLRWDPAALVARVKEWVA